MKNYVKNLTEEDVEKLLDITGYKLATDVENPKTLELMPAIERDYDKENKKHTIFVRCRKKETEYNQKLSLAFKHTISLKLIMVLKSLPTYSNYLDDTGFIIISDFEFNECFMSNILNRQADKADDNLEKFTSFMVDKFGDEYVKDYNAFADEYNKKLEEEKAKQEKEEITQSEEEKAIEEKEEIKDF